MNIDFNDIEFSILPAFKGGEKEYKAKIFSDNLNKIMKGCLVPGASIGVHTHTDGSEVMFFTSGSGSVIYDGKKSKIEAGMCHYCPKGHNHTLINDSDSDLEFYAVVTIQ